MIATRMKRLPLAVLTTLVAALAGATGAHAEETYTGPVKEILSIRIGSEVNKATKGGVCLVASEECQEARASSQPDGFEFAKSVAVDGDKASPQYGHVYVTDTTHRVQELEAGGAFVRTFGWDVNKTKVELGEAATQAEKNVCTEEEIKTKGVECQPGVPGGAAGQFDEGQNSIAVDPASGAVYVTDGVKATSGERVQEFSATGEWVLEIGREVNATTGGNVCTEEETKAKGVECTAPAQYQVAEPGAFEGQTVLTVGGREDLLYAGSGQRIQEFTTGGTFKTQIALATPIGGLALDDSCRLNELTEGTTPTCASFDPSYGDLYVVPIAEAGTVVHKLDPSGAPLVEFPLEARAENAEFFRIQSLTVDPSGRRLAVSESEKINGGLALFGSLFNAATGHLITEFQVPCSQPLLDLAFSANNGDELHSVCHNETIAYLGAHVAELLQSPATCAPGPENETNAAFDCTLNGEVNPEAVEGTEAWFQWGQTPALGEVAPMSPIAIPTGGTPVAVPPPPAPPGVLIEGMRPNQTVYYRLAAHDRNVKTPELLTSETEKFKTPMVAPRTVGAPSAPFVRSSSAVLFGGLNPENAPTQYFFEYGTVLAGYCEGVLRAKTLESAVYGKIGATFEVTGLQPATTYQYRLCATDEAGKAHDEHDGSEIPAGAFTTLSSPVPQAETGGYSALTTISAIVSGTVNPDGQPATYAFELGVNGVAATHYVTVFSGSVAANTAPVEETLSLTGLQPGTTYAYRISIKSGYGESTGDAHTFTTPGLPEVLGVSAPLAMLPPPPIPFPKPECKHGYTRDKHGKCVKVKPKPKKKGKGRAKSKRANHKSGHGKGPATHR
jgi:hypothetical protein